MNKKVIAVIEDEKVLSKMLTGALLDEGFEVVHATDGEEGVRLIESKEIDLVLLDILLPKMNGLELLKKIRENDKYKDIKFVILSVVNDLDKVAVAMEGGVYTYLIKDKTEISDIIKIVKEKLLM